jgi:hypothetical protein
MSGNFIRAGPGERKSTYLSNRIFDGIPHGCSHFYFRGIDEFLRHLRLRDGARSTSFRGGLLLDGLTLPPPLGGKGVRIIHPQPVRWGSFML